jgi:hypothetical protein
MKKQLLILIVVIIFFVSSFSCSFAARRPLVSNFGIDTTGTDPMKLDLSGGNVVLDTATQNWRIYYTREDESTTYYVFQPATRVNVVVQGEVSLDMVNNDYTYKYTLNSLSNSTQKVRIFDVFDITSSVSNIVAPGGWDYLFLEGDTDVFWCDDSTGLTPGMSTTGLKFESSYLPSIVSCRSQGVVPWVIFPGEEVEWAPEVEPSVLGNSVVGETIGPKVFPEPISSIDTATTFINTLIWYTDESYIQGWIESTKVRDKYKRILQDCRTALTKHNQHLASMKLQQIIDTAESDFATHRILSEAYALLKYNVKYLKDQLP